MFFCAPDSKSFNIEHTSSTLVHIGAHFKLLKSIQCIEGCTDIVNRLCGLNENGNTGIKYYILYVQ